MALRNVQTHIVSLINPALVLSFSLDLFLLFNNKKHTEYHQTEVFKHVAPGSRPGVSVSSPYFLSSLLLFPPLLFVLVVLCKC